MVARAGTMEGVATDFAVDGIDELLLGFYARGRNRVRTDTARTLMVTAVDADATWLLRLGPEGARPERYAPETSDPGAPAADAEVQGPASALYLGLWNRGRLDLLDTSGDASLVALWHANSGVRWR